MNAVKLPKGAPKIPRGWEYKGMAWQTDKPTKYGCWKPGEPDWGPMKITYDMTGADKDYHYIAPISAKSPAPKPRRESRVSRIATVIQRVKTGELSSAQEGAKLVERIIDNSQRAKRRKEGK